MKKFIFLIIFILIATIMFTSHKVEKIPPGYDVITAQATAVTKQLFFSGNIQPIRSYFVTSSVEGVIEKKQSEYGQQLKQGDNLFTVRSTELEKEYRDTLASYLKA